MSDEEIILTRTGYEQLKSELETLLEEEAVEMQERMAAVRDEPDGAQDPEFFDAMTDKNQLDERIARLRMILAHATIIDEDPDPEKASPGDRVTVLDLDTDEEMDFDLLGGQEVAHGRAGVSIDSPVGKALLNQKIGATIEVNIPDGKARYKIVNLQPIPQTG